MILNHTPTPFRVGRPGTVVSDSAEGLTLNGATGPENVKHYGGNLIAESVSPENAEFISRACSAFDLFVSGAEEALEQLKYEGMTVEALEKALAIAKGEA
jgi:hypothetical protein